MEEVSVFLLSSGNCYNFVRTHFIMDNNYTLLLQKCMAVLTVI